MGKVVALRKNDEYTRQACEYLPEASYRGALTIYRELLNDPHLDDSVVARVAEADRFFLLTHVLRRPDALNPWLYERCREVEAQPDECLDLWARGHYKSTIITFAGSFQEIIRDPEITIAILANTRPIAKGFLSQIQQEAETNTLLFELWPDIFWADPRKEASSWSLDFGIVFKRKSNPKEKTVEAHGLIDGQPISRHYRLRIYNDIVTEASVSTPEMILKTTDRWELSQNLGQAETEGVVSRRWHEGTRYNFADTYGVIINRKALTARIHPATDDGTMDGKPIFLTQAAWDRLKRDASARTIATQQLLNPLAGEEQELKPEWIRRYEIRPETLNIALLVDPASSKKKESCNSAFIVVGMDAAWNKYLLDGAIHKMNLTERWTMLKHLRNRWIRQPGIQVVHVGYEKYGMQADIEAHQQMMQIEEAQFPIEEVNWPRDRQAGAKDDRIRRLIPDHQNWRFFYPEVTYNPESREFNFNPPGTRRQLEAIRRNKPHLVAQRILRKDENGRLYNLVERLINNEYLFFPATTAKDGLDAMSRFYDLEIKPPQLVQDRDTLPEPEEM
jgi:hypothetical protein